MSTKVGIIGAGGMLQYHAAGFRAAGADIVAICDVNETAAKSAASNLNVEHVFSDVADMLQNLSDLDAVSVITPNRFHKPLAIQLLEAGKHVFCEKPPGRNLEDIERMRDAEAANPGTKLMFGFNHRFHPGVMRAKSIIDSGRMGRIVALRGLYGKSGGKNFAQSWRACQEVASY